MTPSIEDRVVSFISYYTFGIFGLVWLIFTYAIKRKVTPFLSYNIYQAIFISIVFAVISLVYDIAMGLMNIIPIISNLAKVFDTILNKVPVFFTFSLASLIVTVFITLLALISLFGYKPKLPVVSDIIKANFGG